MIFRNPVSARGFDPLQRTFQPLHRDRELPMVTNPKPDGPNREGGSRPGIASRIRSGDQSALAAEFSRHRPRLRKLLSYRMDPRLVGRVDPSDVIQETYLEASRRMADCPSSGTVSSYVWIRSLVIQQLYGHYRRHLGTKKRDAGREIRFAHPLFSNPDSVTLAGELVGNRTSPSLVVSRNEGLGYLSEALERLEPLDREVLCLRHIEQLSNAEVAFALDLAPSAASNRYIRALRRLREILGNACPSLFDPSGMLRRPESRQE